MVSKSELSNSGCRDAILPGHTGLLVPVRDSVALAEAIQTLIEQPDLRNAMGRNGRQLAEERFRIEAVIDQHLAAYAELASAMQE
ncbi:MAG: glycosyltransferase [Alphaproteobacteria bacterium]|nr:MAG: glycosyltransferase [Alphaproteobacteria bacterium]